MILHLIAYEKFTEDYIQKINKLFDKNDHLFLVFGKKTEVNIKSIDADNVIYSVDFRNKALCVLFLIWKILSSYKVIIHALFLSNSYLKILLLLQPIAGNKYFWNIWGYDLYNSYWNREKSPEREKLRVKFIKKLKAVGYIKSDYRFLKKNYETSAKFYLASYVYDFFIPDVNEDKEDKTINILLGNSATEESQYEEVIDLLASYYYKPIKVLCVLSYPKENVQYRDKIINYGYEKLKEKFIPVIDFLSYEKYTEILHKTDIAFFNHNRQQALGNIATLLYLGKRVYINPSNGCKEYFEDMGARVFSIDSFSEKDICKTKSVELIDLNRKAIKDFFSDSNFKARWEKIFKEKY